MKKNNFISIIIYQMEINEKYIIKKAVEKTEQQIWRTLQDLFVDCIKDNEDKKEIIKAVLEELLNNRVWNILSMLK